MNLTKNFALWIIIALLLIALFNLFDGTASHGPQSDIAYSEFLTEVANGRVADVTIQGSTISGHFRVTAVRSRPMRRTIPTW